jgi:hypothetical protein
MGLNVTFSGTALTLDNGTAIAIKEIEHFITAGEALGGSATISLVMDSTKIFNINVVRYSPSNVVLQEYDGIIYVQTTNALQVSDNLLGWNENDILKITIMYKK